MSIGFGNVKRHLLRKSFLELSEELSLGERLFAGVLVVELHDLLGGQTRVLDQKLHLLLEGQLIRGRVTLPHPR